MAENFVFDFTTVNKIIRAETAGEYFKVSYKDDSLQPFSKLKLSGSKNNWKDTASDLAKTTVYVPSYRIAGTFDDVSRYLNELEAGGLLPGEYAQSFLENAFTINTYRSGSQQEIFEWTVSTNNVVSFTTVTGTFKENYDLHLEHAKNNAVRQPKVLPRFLNFDLLSQVADAYRKEPAEAKAQRVASAPRTVRGRYKDRVDVKTRLQEAVRNGKYLDVSKTTPSGLGTRINPRLPNKAVQLNEAEDDHFSKVYFFSGRQGDSDVSGLYNFLRLMFPEKSDVEVREDFDGLIRHDRLQRQMRSTLSPRSAPSSPAISSPSYQGRSSPSYQGRSSPSRARATSIRPIQVVPGSGPRASSPHGRSRASSPRQ